MINRVKITIHLYLGGFVIIKYRAFTLAEILITLGIIGIVAAMTLPTIIQKQNEKTTVSRLKKIYSTLSQAYLSILSEEGSPDGWGLGAIHTEGNGQILMEKFSKYLKLTKNCGTTKEGCYHNRNNIGASAILYDGSLIYLESWTPDCSSNFGTINQLQNMCAFIEVDVNGFKKPNKSGHDMFRFFITKTSIYPYGTAMQSDRGNSTLHDTLIFEDCAKHASERGSLGCTAWVIYNENQDYLHCKDLSWNGKNKCK